MISRPGRKTGGIDMRAKLIQLLLSGVLVLPVCLTGIVTAFQFQESREVLANDTSLVRPSDNVLAGDGILDESEPATAIAPAAPGTPAVSSETAKPQDEDDTPAV